jgi:hypothetical protein
MPSKPFKSSTALNNLRRKPSSLDASSFGRNGGVMTRRFEDISFTANPAVRVSKNSVIVNQAVW